MTKMSKIVVTEEVMGNRDSWTVIVPENMVQSQREAIARDILPRGSIRTVQVEEVTNLH